MIISFYFISSLLLFGYVALLFTYWIGWMLIKAFGNDPINANSKQHTFSILIPSRNEEAVIQKCLDDIVNQHFDKSEYEIIVINDHSTDNTESKVLEFIANHQSCDIKLLNMKDDLQQRKLKKASITFGIASAKNEYIILTDADCERKENWLNTINQFINCNQSKMIYAPVQFKADNIFQKIQSLEFAGLVGIGASAIRLKQPNMCSAANLIFEKTAFNEVGGYKGDEGIASGDDEFLMHKIFKKFPGKVHFLKNTDAIVSTSANVSIKELTDQRRRWVSKSTKYGNRYITLILVLAYLFNASIVIAFFLNFYFGLMMLLVKLSVELLFLNSVLRFFKQSKYLFILPVAEIFHICYVLIIGIWANIGTYQWKGRKVK